jgi:hypothetical protein
LKPVLESNRMTRLTPKLCFLLGGCALVLGGVACAGTLDDPARFEPHAATDAGVSEGAAAPCPDIPKDVFATTCSTAGCHGTVDRAQGLDLQSPNVASRLVNVHAMGGGVLVDPANANQSVIYTKVLSAPPFGGRMPIGKPPLDDATVACVLSWVSGQTPR